MTRVTAALLWACCCAVLVAASDDSTDADAEEKPTKLEQATFWHAAQPVMILQSTFCRLNELLFTAMGWILIPAYCSANP